jgi:hypothetical protein
MAALCIAHLGAFLSAPLRSGRAQMSLAVAPPAAPPTITGGGGGDGGGGGPGEFLRMLTSTEVRSGAQAGGAGDPAAAFVPQIELFRRMCGRCGPCEAMPAALRPLRKRDS